MLNSYLPLPLGEAVMRTDLFGTRIRELKSTDHHTPALRDLLIALTSAGNSYGHDMCRIRLRPLAGKCATMLSPRWPIWLVCAISLTPHYILSTYFHHPEVWLRHACSKLPPEAADRFLMICWAIWNNRNKVVMENKGPPVEEVVALAESFLHEFVEIRARLIPSQLIQREGRIWQPPPQDTVKINFDGAVFGSSASLGVGVIVRNREGMAWCYELQQQQLSVTATATPS
ncbi:UNVERIFIED_CONTAM: hypothetical protein Sindi_1318700 [Sesamum indicum]